MNDHRLFPAALLLLAAILVAGCDKAPLPPASSAPPPVSAAAAPDKSAGPAFAEARARFQTKLVRQSAAPQDYEEAIPPQGVRKIPYSSGDLKLTAWVTAAPPAGGKHPAVLFLHGGFAFSAQDWDMAQPYRDAGFVVLMPMLRGENGLPGHYSMFFHEVDDVLAAADALSGLPYVDAGKLFVAGHSIGGTLTMLACMASPRFKAAASFSGSPDQIAWSAGQPELVPFDAGNIEEFRIRSPLGFAATFQCPARLYHGSEEGFFAGRTVRLAKAAAAAGLDVQCVSVKGDHMSHVKEAMQQSIAFFQST